MPMENQLAHAITQTEYDLSYDKAAKKLLANKQILAQIMKNCVNEYSACSVDEIAEKYIEGTPEVGTVGVHVDDTNRPKKTSDVIAGSNNEDSTLTEGTINYDVRFDAIAPASEGSAEQKDVIRLIINVEAQTAFNPGYPLTKRAIYYCSRMISAQHGPIFTNSEYGKIRKVYSIWVCTHGVIRCFVEGLRTDSLYLMPGVRVSQVLSGCLILLGVLLVGIIRRRQDIQVWN